MAETLSLKSIETRAETPSIQTFFFELATADFDYRPGQYITVKLLDNIEDPRGPQRPFTLSSSPTEKLISISVKMTGSPFKKQLQSIADQQENPDTHLKLRGALGSFTLDAQRPAVCIAGGIGITPFRSMLRYIDDRKINLPVSLLYSSSSADDIAFRDELDEIANKDSGLKTVYTITGSRAGNLRQPAKSGRIDAALIHQVSSRMQEPVYYVCGPPAMVTAMADILGSELGVGEADIRVEKFVGY